MKVTRVCNNDKTLTLESRIDMVLTCNKDVYFNTEVNIWSGSTAASYPLVAAKYWFRWWMETTSPPSADSFSNEFKNDSTKHGRFVRKILIIGIIKET